MEYFTKHKEKLDLRLEVYKVHADYIGRCSMETLSVLTCIYFSDAGKAPCRVLKRLLKMTAPQMTRSVQSLAQAGIVYYTQCPDDGRGKFICLTILGEKLRDTYINSALNCTEERKTK